MGADELTLEAIVAADVDVARANEALRAATREVDRLQIAVSAAERRRDGLVRRWRREQLDERPAPPAGPSIPTGPAGGPAAGTASINVTSPAPDVRVIPVPVEPRHRT